MTICGTSCSTHTHTHITWAFVRDSGLYWATTNHIPFGGHYTATDARPSIMYGLACWMSAHALRSSNILNKDKKNINSQRRINSPSAYGYGSELLQRNCKSHHGYRIRPGGFPHAKLARDLDIHIHIQSNGCTLDRACFLRMPSAVCAIGSNQVHVRPS